MQASSLLKATAVTLAALAATAGAAAPDTAADPYGATVLHSFGTRTSTGYLPDGGALALGRDGNFYGATMFGGANGSGSLFRMTPDGRTTTLYSFSPEPKNADGSPGPNADGGYPQNGLVEGPDGSWYGVAVYGGSDGNGTVFKLSPKGTLTVLHSFSATTSPATNADGAQPNAPLLPTADGSLYGTALYGGGHAGGTAFRITRDGSFTAFYQFGTPLSLSPHGIAEPVGGLVLGDDGAFYGMTVIGGEPGAGSIYRLTPFGGVTLLHAFDPLNSDGVYGGGTLTKGSDGNFYGSTLYTTSFQPGANMAPTLFRISPRGQYTELHSGNDQGPYTGQALNIDGIGGSGGMVQASDGNLYGVMSGGGEFGSGVIYRLTPAGEFTTVYNFGITATDGIAPSGGLTLGSDGNLYGTTSGGGTQDKGSAFMLPLPVPAGWDTGPAITITSKMKPTRISRSKGQTATLTWSSVNAAQCHLWDGIEGHSPQTVATSGSMSIAPTKLQEYIYTMGCDNAGRVTSVIAGEVIVAR